MKTATVKQADSHASEYHPTNNLTSWTTTYLPATVVNSQAIVTKNRVYLLGGYIDRSYSGIVYTAPINPDGTLGAWTTSTPLPAKVLASQAIVTKNRVYLLGGRTGSGGSSTVYTAPINLDGTLDAWSTSTSLPAAINYHRAIVTKNRVYVMGGVTDNTGTGSSAVYTTPINPDGTLGTWTTSTPLPNTVYGSQAVVTKNRVYLLGGYIGSGTAGSSTVYTAPINPDGTLGAWDYSASLPAAVTLSQVVVTKNRVYLLGGVNNNDHLSTVYTASINPDGTLGTWTTSTALPVAICSSQAVVTTNRVYLLGGHTGSGGSSAVYTSVISG